MQRLRSDPLPPPRLRLMLTGFGPFPGIPVNASMVLVAELSRRLTRAKAPIELRTATLPTEWKAGPAVLQEAVTAFKPDIALHFGVASEVTGFRLETLAQNGRIPLADACGYAPRRGPISTVQPETLLSTFPADRIRARLETLGIRVELSADAGRYLCNAALFRSLTLSLKAKGAPITGFVHIPSALADPEQAHSLQDFDWSHAITGGLAIVETCLVQASTRLEHVTNGPAGVPA
jgi:pyroglutamyl-peptidase